MEKVIAIKCQVYASAEELSAPDAELLQLARATTAHAYAPYSNFRVAAAGRLANGALLSATNQENASYPVGICAERCLLATVGALHPNAPIHTIAISYTPSHAAAGHTPVAPCGVCRQSLAEYAQRTNQPIRLLLAGQSGEVWCFDNADHLLPFGFSSSHL
jgi:cytidine deaminase